jgi:biopolymer transport protein TolQ
MMLLMVNVPVGSMVSAFILSNLAGKAIVLVLVVASVIVWSLLVAKWLDLQQAAEATRNFLSAYRKEAHPVALFLKRQRYEPSPVYSIYEKTCRALGGALEGRSSDAEDLFMGAVGSTNQKLNDIQSNAVRNAADRARATQTVALERNMGFVALATTSAPLLGLLGTLWAAMDAFDKTPPQGTDLASLIAPIVSGALLPMVVGLLVAIPSGIGYTVLTDRIRRLGVEMEEFSREVLSSMEAHYLQRK